MNLFFEIASKAHLTTKFIEATRIFDLKYVLSDPNEKNRMEFGEKDLAYLHQFYSTKYIEGKDRLKDPSWVELVSIFEKSLSHFRLFKRRLIVNFDDDFKKKMKEELWDEIKTHHTRIE